MKESIGVALVLGCAWVMWLVRARGSEPVGFLKNDTAQTFFMIGWLLVFLLGNALALQHFGS